MLHRQQPLQPKISQPQVAHGETSCHDLTGIKLARRIPVLAMRARLALRREQPVFAVVVVPTSATPRFRCARSFPSPARFLSSKSRPSLPFLTVPQASPSVARLYTSERKRWLKHEAKLAVRYTLTLWGLAACALVILFFVNEEASEREYPTPHEWDFFTRKLLRDARDFKDPKDGEVNWARCLELAREAVLRLEDPRVGGGNLVRLSDKLDFSLDVPEEFVHYDISAMSEEWRRGYFEAVMLAAQAAEHVDGWLRDTTRNLVCPPEFAVGPSNPRPRPIPPGSPHAPREADCQLAYPPADRFYLKILATQGLSSRQRMEAALAYASFTDFKNRTGAEALYALALSEAGAGLETSDLPDGAKTLLTKSGAPPPSANLLDALTAFANHKARQGDVSLALPIYVSLLKARRSLSDKPTETAPSRARKRSSYEQLTQLLLPPAYPPPGPDGTQPPWRDPYERCQEAALHLYMGEILYATSAADDGLAWTRDGVDIAEEQLRALGAASKDKRAKRTCRECLTTGLENWSTMVSRLAKAEAAEKSNGARPSMFSFWGGPQDTDGRWAAEKAVVEERTRRTRELLEDLSPPAPGITSYFKP